MPKTSFWQPKLRTASAMVRLCRAQLLVNYVPYDRWRNRLGLAADVETRHAVEIGRRLAADIEWAASRLPFGTKCLPRAMALSWILRRRNLRHSVVIAVRPSQLRASPDALHAWIEVEGQKIIGDLPGPWIEIARLG